MYQTSYEQKTINIQADYFLLYSCFSLSFYIKQFLFVRGNFTFDFILGTREIFLIIRGSISDRIYCVTVSGMWSCS
jgi:hypothetical protein